MGAASRCFNHYLLRPFFADSNSRIFNIDDQIAAHRADDRDHCARYKALVLQVRSNIGISADPFDDIFFTDNCKRQRHSNTPFPFVN